MNTIRGIKTQWLHETLGDVRLRIRFGAVRLGSNDRPVDRDPKFGTWSGFSAIL